MSPILTLQIDPKQPDTLVVSSDKVSNPPSSSTTEHLDIADQIQTLSLSQDETHPIFCINDPQTLSSLAAQLATSEPNIAVKTAKGSTDTLDKASVKTLRLSVFSPIIGCRELSETEKLGAPGPITMSLVQSWREAYRSLPRHHHIEIVQWDLNCCHQFEHCRSYVLSRFMQEVSTGLYMKAKKSMGREVRFAVTGYETDDGGEFYASGLPGKDMEGKLLDGKVDEKKKDKEKEQMRIVFV